MEYIYSCNRLLKNGILELIPYVKSQTPFSFYSITSNYIILFISYFGNYITCNCYCSARSFTHNFRNLDAMEGKEYSWKLWLLFIPSFKNNYYHNTHCRYIAIHFLFICSMQTILPTYKQRMSQYNLFKGK